MGLASEHAFRVISGGQTGVDRGALDAALDLGVSCGGWCPAGRTVHTIESCRELGRPHLIVDAAAVALEEAVRRAVHFVTNERIRRLNVAGPRASGDSRGYGYAYALVRQLCGKR